MAKRRGVVLAALVLMLAASLTLPAGAQTTSLTVIRHGFDNVTVAESVTVDVSWMRTNLRVHGDGVTPYYMQGATITEVPPWNMDVWNKAETMNITKLDETLKGTSVRDLVELVGGMHPGDEVKVKGVGPSGTVDMIKWLAYENVYAPPARQGPPVLAWWNQRNGFAWNVSMRLYFLADTSVNPYGWHVFGNEDMRQSMDEQYWYWYTWTRPVYPYDKVDYPSAAGLSVKNVTSLEILPAPRAIAVPGVAGLPGDLDGNGKYEDVNANGRRDFADVVVYFNQMAWIARNEPVPFFDYNANRRIDFADVVLLFNSL